MTRALLLSALIAAAIQTAHAQDQTGITQGLQYMQGVKPTAKGQIVNPSGVSSSAWTSTAIPTAVPQNMGALSNPNTSQTTLAQARAAGLGGWGMQTQTQCANYILGSGDAYLDQQCAAVNFLSNSCLPQSNTEKQVIGGVNNITAGTTNCTGTYGAGAANFNFANTLTSGDSIFTNINNARSTANMILGGDQACSEQTIVTKPAQTALNTCITSTQTDALPCTQDLSTKIVTTAQTPTVTDTCPQGIQVGNYCQNSTSGDAMVNYACPAGYQLEGSNCVGSTTFPATVVSYTCSAGLTLQSDNTCQGTSSSSSPATANYSCPNGGALQGTQCVTQVVSPAAPVYSCSSGTLNGAYCYTTTETNPVYATACPTGTTSAGKSASGQLLCKKSAQVTVGCASPSGFVIYDVETTTGSKVETCTYVAAASCTSGALSGSQCVTTSTSVATITDYSCTSGNVSGSNCVTTQSTGASITYSCPAGQTEVGTNCTQTTTVTSAATPNYSCPTGDTLQGTQCVGVVDQAASVSYSCPAGATLSGQTCTTVTTVPVTEVYSCVDGSAPINGVCQIKSVQSNWTDTCGVYEASSGSMLPPPN